MDRKQMSSVLDEIGDYFERRMREAPGESREIFRQWADDLHRAAATILSDEETIREYEEAVDRMEDDGK